ncbi:hypothetical protein A3B63_03335 [Candidatus Saccharibacteria bacterium RIFCSPLOWO2_01_FULL_49_22]|nr:MAG: hypothetical protein A3B63_03335 [Candidatus Saccharibacteria bacterium RIFCSPLOWO2_01_FULL_49_22]
MLGIPSIFAPCSVGGILMAETARQLTEFNRPDHQHELGHLAIHEKLSNDSLAHVWRLMEGGDPSSIEHQIRTEFHSDIGERTGHANKERHYYKTWHFHLEDNDLISDTGLSLRELTTNGLEAAANNARLDSRFEYHYQRAQVQELHPDMLIDWRQSGDPRCVRLISLCPEEQEVSSEIAKLGNFKPERAMASVWIFEPTEEGICLHAFSQDNTTLQDQKANDQRMGVRGGDYSSSMAKLSQLDFLDYTDGQEAAAAHKNIHDSRMEQKTGLPYHFGIENPLTYEEAIAAVEAKPKAWELYREAVAAVAGSLNVEVVTPELAKLVMRLRQSYDAEDAPPPLQIYWQRPLSEGQARDFMDYLRERSIPQYVFGEPETYQLAEANELGEDNYSELATAGAYSVENNIVHSGDCPGGASQVGTDQELASALQIAGHQEFESSWCPNCLKKPKTGKTVKAWREGDKIGCYDCGHVQDVCGQVIKRGKRLAEAKDKVMGLADFVVSSLPRYFESFKNPPKT